MTTLHVSRAAGCALVDGLLTRAARALPDTGGPGVR